MTEHECSTCGMTYICGDPGCDLHFKSLHHKVIIKTLVGCQLIKEAMASEFKTKTETRILGEILTVKPDKPKEKGS